MNVAVPREHAAGERRVALTPDAVARLEPLGLTVVVESGAGDGAALPDDAYREAGATVVATAADLYAQGDIVVRVGRIEAGEVAALRPGPVLVGWLWPLINPDLVQALAARVSPRSGWSRSRASPAPRGWTRSRRRRRCRLQGGAARRRGAAASSSRC